jgi:multicomponent Na+:H+ antiporter subunit E
VAGLLGFVPFFLWESLRGGVDVAARVMGRRLRIAPGFVTFSTRLPAGGARIFFVNCISLLPGTLAADLRGNTVRVHCLDRGSDIVPELRRLERAVLRLFPRARPVLEGPGHG